MWWGQNTNFLKLVIQKKCCEIFNSKFSTLNLKILPAFTFSAFLQAFRKCNYIPVENTRGLFQNCPVTKQENCFRVLEKKKKKKKPVPNLEGETHKGQ